MKHLLVLFIALLPASALNAQSLIQTIAFGSCNRENRPQSHWVPIAATNPDVFIWTGDNIYADTQDPAVFRTKYDMQLNHPEYVKFLSKVPRVIGTWDDHDYGVNDGGKEYPAKELAKSEHRKYVHENQANCRGLTSHGNEKRLVYRYGNSDKSWRIQQHRH
jgi:alkaline phosphatase D